MKANVLQNVLRQCLRILTRFLYCIHYFNYNKDKFVKNAIIHAKVAQEINQLNVLLA